MEKRFLLSVILSFLVLFAWGALKKSPEVKNEDSAIFEAEKRVTSKTSSVIEPAKEELLQDLSLPEVKSNNNIKNFVLESDLLTVEISNLGAAIKSIYIKDHELSLPITNMLILDEYKNVEFHVKQRTDSQITLSYNNESFEIMRSFSVNEGEYIVRDKTTVKNKTLMSKLNDFSQISYVIDTEDVEKSGSKENSTYARDKALFEYVIKSDKETVRKNKAHKFSEKNRSDMDAQVNWVGFRDRYYCVLVKPGFATTGYKTKDLSENKLSISVHSDKIEFGPGETLEFSSQIYYGPENIKILAQYDESFKELQKYYKFGLLDGIAKAIDWLMHILYKIIPNWGLCIILMSTIIYFSMYPLTARGMASMRRMQGLQPKIAELKEKHKSNPQKMNQEMMELYKREKINPLGGCFPILLQMPVFIGLYQVLWRSVAFKGASFLWIKDLSQPDQLFIMPFSIPFLGNEFNLLPIFMMGIMFFQQKLTSKNMVITDPMQLQQQKMMTTIMPVFLGFIFYKFASGLTLYFTMFYLFSTFTQWKIANKPKVT